MVVFGLTDQGKVRSMNQDVFRIWESPGVCVFTVCDGMGGANSGEVASDIAAGTFMDAITAALAKPSVSAGGALASAMSAAVVRAGEAVYERAISDPACDGMGTTLVAAAVVNGLAVVANVGDSRAYHISSSAESGGARVTRDHSVVEEMIERGELTPEQARVHPSRNLITRALGSTRFERPDIFEARLEAGDKLLLCSDGLSNMLTDEELYEYVRQARPSGDPAPAVTALMEEALGRGAPDNVTVALFVL
ncbi:MAG: Stp1/IreP family PP2C-type Ser/Thr phosphatase [Oscillospiraceae bacterium]|jgi:protein phosphatase|nr:Stp1/IreP family PP2C-type Ser/Thr phosphatase [Oscillospiraceae bacterium]